MNMKRVTTLILAMLLCACFVLPAAAATVERNAVVSVELAGERNVATDTAPIAGGWAGTAVTIGAKDITLTHIGRMWFTGASTTHCFMVANPDGSLLVDYSRLDSNIEELTDGQFVYYTLPTPVTLVAGQTYYFVSDFWGAEDRHYDSSTVVASEDVSFIGTVALNAAGGWDLTEKANANYFPLDFKYTVEVADTPVDPNPGENDPPAQTGDGLTMAAAVLALVSGTAAVVLCTRKKEN